MIKIRKAIPISHLQAITKASQEKKLPLDGILSLVHQLALVMFVSAGVLEARKTDTCYHFFKNHEGDGNSAKESVPRHSRSKLRDKTSQGSRWYTLSSVLFCFGCNPLRYFSQTLFIYLFSLHKREKPKHEKRINIVFFAGLVQSREVIPSTHLGGVTGAIQETEEAINGILSS